MKYAGMPQGMWLLYKKPFQKNLTGILGIGEKDAKIIAGRAALKYREIISGLPDFEKEDRFRMNIVNCAVLIAFLLNIKEKPSVEKLTEYYSRSMMTLPTRLFCRIGGISKFSKRDIESMKKTAALKAADRNPYSWNMDYLPYPDGSGYEARFSKCGICTLMKEYGLYDLIPAMCHLDYDMTAAGKTSEFIRNYTLASGGPYCDCGYKRKVK